MGRILARLSPLKKEYKTYFLFPFYHTGGAEKIHAQIAEATGDKDCIIYFTRKSVNNTFLDKFEHTGCTIKNISSFTDNRWLYFLNLIYRGIVTGHINNQKLRPVVFNGQSNFGYKISPWVNKNIRQIELIHSFNSFSYIRIPFLPFISQTVMISKKRISDHIEFYKKVSIPDHYIDKITYISNAIKIPLHSKEKSDKHLTVLYVGRNGVEKRLYLILEIAKKLNTIDPTIKFEIMGDVSDAASERTHPFITFHGNQTDDDAINNVYENAHILILTSTTEGSPMAVIEAMANGCAIVATPVGDIPLHVHNGENGFLFSSVNDEAKIVTEAIEMIIQLKNNRQKLKDISKNNFNYAAHNFGIDKFNEAYRQIINQKN